MKIALVANGEMRDPSIIASLMQEYDQVFAIDGGLYHCDQMGINPDLIIGDLDSVDDAIVQKYKDIPIIRYPTDKDKTDLELAISHTMTLNPTHVTVYGALEKRVDHSLYNMYLLTHYPSQLCMESETEQIFAIEHLLNLPCTPGQCISLIPFGGPVEGITTRGLKWELTNATFDTQFMSISNICLKPTIHISLSSGILLCCLTKPE